MPKGNHFNMKKLGLLAKLRWAVLNQPTLIPSIVNDKRFNKQLSTQVLHDMIPRRTSIEIECVNKLTDGLNWQEKGIDRALTDSNREIFPSRRYPLLAKHYNIMELNIDDRRNSNYDEHSISIRNYTQLVGLYNILKDMQKHCILNTASGCHIHVDLNKIIEPKTYLNKENPLFRFFTNKCTNGEIDKLFGKYDGSMMRQKQCGQDWKIEWITYRTNYNSLEFRTPPMTFDYSTIVKWFIGVNKMLNEFEKSLIPAHSTQESPKAEKEYMQIPHEWAIETPTYFHIERNDLINQVPT